MNGTVPTGGGEGSGGVRIAWCGHAAFAITSPGGVRVLTDPYPGNLGYGDRRFQADLVTVSHEHFDHNSVASVEGDPKVLRGLAQGDWAMVEATLGDVTVWSVPGTYHDPSLGSKRGKNALFVIETGGLRVVHLGDLGDMPSDRVFERVGRVDVLLIPVGGFFTIDGPTAREVAARFGARVVIPMHYRTAAIAEWQISDEKPFLEGQVVAVRLLHSYNVTVSPQTLPERPEVWVLEPAPEGRQ